MCLFLTCQVFAMSSMRRLMCSVPTSTLDQHFNAAYLSYLSIFLGLTGFWTSVPSPEDLYMWEQIPSDYWGPISVSWNDFLDGKVSATDLWLILQKNIVYLMQEMML